MKLIRLFELCLCVGLFLTLVPAAFAISTLYEAEELALSNVRVKSTHKGHDGTGYADYDGRGGYVLWSIDAQVAGSHEITLKYASMNKRPLDFQVDESSVTKFDCEATGGWESWDTETHVVRLSKGTHTLKLLAASSFGPNVDWIQIISPDPVLETVHYEAEDSLFHRVKIDTRHKGYEGSGYADFQGQYAYVLWEVDVQFDADYVVEARYAAASGREAVLSIDDVYQGTFGFDPTGGWTSWGTESITVVSLQEGKHILKIEAEKSQGPNLDRVSLTPCLAGNCVTLQTPAPSPSPVQQTVAPSPSPVQQTAAPSPSPVQQTTAPSPSPIKTTGSTVYASAVVIESGGNLDRGDFVSSPNGEFRFGLTALGDLVLEGKGFEEIWRAGVQGHKCHMQPDGNVIVRSEGGGALWKSETYNNPDARLEIDDGGQVAVILEKYPLWLEGIPRDVYASRATRTGDLSFPVRGVFYYPWYPETWTVNKMEARFIPELGKYSSSNADIAEAHIDAMEYAHVDLSIASWWGPDTNLDRARLLMLMQETVELNSQIKWSIYHEDERRGRPLPNDIKQDLDYLKKWFAWHPAWAHVDGRPVIFVYNAQGCDVAERWMEASAGDWFVVLKLFPDFRNCAIQPDSWHQYGVGDGSPLQYQDYSFSIAPGFWKADEASPRLPRVDRTRWCNNVQRMSQSSEPWHLIISFNEAGEGTLIEAVSDWSSDTGYGDYLDCLHKYP